MRSGSKGSVYRRLALVALAVAVVGLVAVPVAVAAPSMAIAGLVHGHYYGGVRPLPATVTVPDPSAPTGPPLVTIQADTNGFFITMVPLPALPTYSDLTATASASSFGSKTASFTNSPGTAAEVGPFELVVNKTTVSGTVKSLKTKKPVKGVKVTIGNKSVKTSKKGKYSIVIGLWPATKYKVTFAWKGHKKVTKTITSLPGSIRFLSVALK